MKRKAYILTAAFIILLGIIFLGSAKTQTGRIHPGLEGKLQKLAPGEKLTVIVELMEKEKLFDVAARIPGAKRKDRARGGRGGQGPQKPG